MNLLRNGKYVFKCNKRRPLISAGGMSVLKLIGATSIKDVIIMATGMRQNKSISIYIILCLRAYIVCMGEISKPHCAVRGFGKSSVDVWYCVPYGVGGQSPIICDSDKNAKTN